MDLIIRAAELKDAADMAEMRRQTGVKENTLGLITDSTARAESFLKEPQSGRYTLVGELEGKVVGVVGISTEVNPRMNHVAHLGISVNANYQGRGIGKKLMEAIIELSENWLMNLRLELGVIVDNEKAIGLYESLGFVKEGIKRCSIKRNGAFVDEYIMAKLNPHLLNSIKGDFHAE